MTRVRRFLSAFAFAGLCALPALAEEAASGEERVIAALSQNTVGITADFSGSEIFVFGAIERNRLARADDAELEVIITVTGPDERVVLRKKDRRFGIWVNAESAEIDAAPSFYAVATSGPLAEILSDTADLRHKITVHRVIRLVGEAEKTDDPREFSDAIIRLRRASGVYFNQIGAVEIIGGTLFQTRIKLPSNIVEGDYSAHVYLLRDGHVVDEFVTAIDVSKVGFERWVYTLAHEQSLLYGLFSIFVALLAGWGASEIFRQLRR